MVDVVTVQLGQYGVYLVDCFHEEAKKVKNGKVVLCWSYEVGFLRFRGGAGVVGNFASSMG